jgi:hypothetical protein
MEKKLFICSCGSHGITISKDDDMIYVIAFWYLSNYKITRLWKRIVYAFKIIFKKDHLLETLVLNEEEYNNFIQYVQSFKK